MWSPGGQRPTPFATRLCRVTAIAVLVLVAVAGVASAQAPAELRVERDSFWYECAAPAGAPSDPSGGEPEAPPCARRLVVALELVVREHPEKFPQPPPLTTVIRAVPREQLGSSPLWSSALGSYGCATLVDGVVVIEIGPSTFIGRDALNDAELRSFLAHELVHAYQFARGTHAGRPGELARRELEALDWELAHLEPDVSVAYRADLVFNRKMYAAMLQD